jgi:hypothetical protein
MITDFTAQGKSIAAQVSEINKLASNEFQPAPEMIYKETPVLKEVVNEELKEN